VAKTATSANASLVHNVEVLIFQKRYIGMFFNIDQEGEALTLHHIFSIMAGIVIVDVENHQMKKINLVIMN